MHLAVHKTEFFQVASILYELSEEFCLGYPQFHLLTHVHSPKRIVGRVGIGTDYVLQPFLLEEVQHQIAAFQGGLGQHFDEVRVLQL